jgi:hypothetical protein
MRRSLASALLGDGQGARRHLEGARRELDRGDHPSDPAWFAFVTPAELTAHEATAAVHLGQAERAAGIYRDVLATQSMSARNRVFYSARLAGALEAAGDHQEAVGIGLGVLSDLEGAVSSGRALNLLKPVRAQHCNVTWRGGVLMGAWCWRARGCCYGVLCWSTASSSSSRGRVSS